MGEDDPLNRFVPDKLLDELFWLPDSARNMGIHLMAGRGSGKSRLMGRVIGWQDFIRGFPLVIFDPVGSTIDNLLDKLLYFPKAIQEQLWKRIIYVDMSGKGERVVPLPLYYKFGDETDYEVAQRYLDTLRSVDPTLEQAPMLGWNALHRVGTRAGMVLSALGFQITEAEDLIQHPQAWTPWLERALRLQPDVAAAVRFFQAELPQMTKRDRDMVTNSFLTKIGLFSLDPTFKAIFGADKPFLNWYDVVSKRQAVLLDFRHVHDLEQRRFKMLWAFYYLLAFIKHRGAGRHRPLSLIIDELAGLTHLQTRGESVFSRVLDELLNVWARNGMVWLTLAHQELFQLEERIQQSLMSLGTQVLGVTSDRKAALAVAQQLYPYDPDNVRRYEPIYANYMGISNVIDERPVDYSIQEQQYLASNVFTNKRLFEFVVRRASAEGNIDPTLYEISIKNFDKGQWIHEEEVGEVRRRLRARTGVRKEDVFATIGSRLTRPPAILAALTHGNHISPPSTDEDEEDIREPSTRSANA